MSSAETRWLFWNKYGVNTVTDFLLYLTSKQLIFSKLFTNYIAAYPSWYLSRYCGHTGLGNKSLEVYLMTLKDKDLRMNPETCPVYENGLESNLHFNESGQVEAFMISGFTPAMESFGKVVEQYKRVSRVAELLSRSLRKWTKQSCTSDVPPVFAYQHIHRLADQFVGIEKAFAALLLTPVFLVLLTSMFSDSLELEEHFLLSAAISVNMLLTGGMIGVTKSAVNPLTVATLPLAAVFVMSVHFKIWYRRHELRKSDLTDFRMLYHAYSKPIIEDLAPLLIFAVALTIMRTALLQKLSQILLITLFSTVVTMALMQIYVTLDVYDRPGVDLCGDSEEQAI